MYVLYRPHIIIYYVNHLSTLIETYLAVAPFIAINTPILDG